MDKNYLSLKTLIIFSAISYFAYTFYWFIKTIPWIIHITQGPKFYSAPTGLLYINTYSLLIGYVTDYMAFLGLTIRVIGATYALLTAILLFKNKTNIQLLIQTKISKTIFFEALYFLSLIPSIYLLLEISALIPKANIFLVLQISIQILLISPILIVLNQKLKKNNINSSSTIKLIIISYLSYVIALWGLYMLKWIGMMIEASALGEINWLQYGIRIFGLLNTAIILSLAVIFAIIGAFQNKRKNIPKTIKWCGLSLVFLSLHFVIYVLYLASVGFWNAILFGELWAIPLLGIGIYMIIKKY